MAEAMAMEGGIGEQVETVLLLARASSSPRYSADTRRGPVQVPVTGVPRSFLDPERTEHRD